jgi:hypothetical protein
MTTPSNLVKRKSLGFGAHAIEEKPLPVIAGGKYPGLGLGRRTADSKEEVVVEDYGDQQQQEQRTRRKSFSILLLDCDKSKSKDHRNSFLSVPTRTFVASISFCSGATDTRNISGCITFDLLAFIILYTEWISLFACVA